MQDDATRCPACGRTNDCGVAAGTPDCWCFAAAVSPLALSALPMGDRGKRCLCAACAMSATTVVLRRATPADAAALQALFGDCTALAVSSGWVAIDTQRTLGAILVEGQEIAGIAVAPDSRRRGVARRLLRRAEIEGVAAGLTRLTVKASGGKELFAAAGYVSGPNETLAKRLAPVIYHNPACGTSRNVLAALQSAGLAPTIVEYLIEPPDRATLLHLIARMGITPRDLLRQKGTPYEELGLHDVRITDDALVDHMLAQPILINRPIVANSARAALCRPSERVHELIAELSVLH